MSYTVTLKDRRTIVVGMSGTPRGDVEAAMLSGSPVRISGMVVSGAMIASVEDGSRDGESGPHLSNIRMEAGQVFLDSHQGGGFDAQAFRIAMERQKQGRAWIHKDLVGHARAECGGTDDAQEVYSFLDAEWERLKDRNVAPKPTRRRDGAGERMSREYLASDQGREYARKVGSLGLDRTVHKAS
jgi:hypothetical protein